MTDSRTTRWPLAAGVKRMLPVACGLWPYLCVTFARQTVPDPCLSTTFSFARKTSRQRRVLPSIRRVPDHNRSIPSPGSSSITPPSKGSLPLRIHHSPV